MNSSMSEISTVPVRRSSWRVKALVGLALVALVFGGLWWWYGRLILRLAE
jgi:hypothetical protein